MKKGSEEHYACDIFMLQTQNTRLLTSNERKDKEKKKLELKGAYKYKIKLPNKISLDILCIFLLAYI
jgi:hypothetical protein